MISKTFILLLCFALCVREADAQQFNKAKLDSFLNTLTEYNEAMGSVAISRNGKLLYEKAAGYSYIHDDEKTAATPRTKYRIASITKLYTATMIFQLIDENKLTPGTTLDTYFPEVPNAKIITIGELLNHRSGLHNYITSLSWRLGPKSENELLAMIAMSKPDFTPDSTTDYSNTNYWLLGFIIERICKMTYAEALQARIVAKLGLKETYYGGKTDIKNNESFSYTFDGEKWDRMPETDMSLLCGAGAILATPTDETKFIEGLFGGKLVSPKSLLEMTSVDERHGIGMASIPFLYHNGFGHTGHVDGFYSVLCYFPEDSLAVALCDNGHVYDLNNILIGILAIYFDSRYTIPDFKAMLDYNTAHLDEYAGTYSSKDVKLKITITKNKTILRGQATGQRSFPLTPIGKNKFRYDPSDIEMDFNTTTHVMVNKQAGMTFIFTRDN